MKVGGTFGDGFTFELGENGLFSKGFGVVRGLAQRCWDCTAICFSVFSQCNMLDFVDEGFVFGVLDEQFGCPACEGHVGLAVVEY